MIGGAVAALADYLASHSRAELWWIAIGLAAQGLFSARFIVQLVASERRRRSVVPEAFWYFSLLGGAMLLAYAIHKRDLVFILGQAFGMVVYARNVYFLWAPPTSTGIGDDAGR